MKWRKLMSGILSAALIATSVTPVAAATESVSEDAAEETADVSLAEEAIDESQEEEQTSAEDGLILYYNFNLQNSYATEIPDESGNGNIGELDSISGSPQGNYTIDEVNIYGNTVKALNLPGEDNGGTFLWFPDNVLQGLDSVTISAWVNLSTDYGYQRIWDFGQDNTAYMYLLSDGGNTGFIGYSAAITKSGWADEKGVSKGTNFDKNRWVLTTVVMDGSKMSLYENGEQIGETVDTGVSLSEIDGDSNMLGYSQFGDGPTEGQFAEVKIYDHALSSDEISAMYDVTDEGIVSTDAFELDLGALSAVTEDIILPLKGTNGSDITWTSQNSAIEVNGNTAKVTRPAAGSDNVEGTLTAVVSYNGAEETKTFDVTVLAKYSDKQIVEHDAQAAQAAVGDLSSVMDSFDVPVSGEWGSTITWTSENSAIEIAEGTAAVTRPQIGEANAEGSIKAVVSYGTESVTIEIPVTVIALREAISLVSYEPVTVTTRVGVYPSLPYYVTVTYSDGSTNKLKAVWSLDISESQYNSVGTFEVSGSIAGEKMTIKATVEVVDEAEAAKYAVSESFDLSDISLASYDEDGSILTQNRDRDIEYLKLLDNDRMLYNFRKTFGADTKGASPLGGWDSSDCLLRGHSTGHYISALSLAYASTGDEELKEKLDEMVRELHSLQQMSQGNAADFVTAGVKTSTWSTDPSEWGEGFLSAYSPDQFALLEQYVGYGSADSGIWAPYYTLHKLLAGFLDAYNYAGNEEALEVAKGIGNWVINRLSACSQEQRTTMWDMYIAGEYGGFNESMAKLYLYTGDEKYIDGAKLFDNTIFFDNLADNIDDIAGRHANQHIPQIIGALEVYKATVATGNPDTYYYDVASNFWEFVVSRYAYSIGGVGTGESFTSAYQQANNISGDTNCETCAAYNMLKLTKELNNFDPDNAEYMDYYERTLYNQILASQTPYTSSGRHNGTTYMLPIGPGQYRDYSDDYNSFTCCHGTGMENHVKYQEAAYVKTDDTLYVGLYLPSTVTWDEMGVEVQQITEFPSDYSKFIVSGNESASFDMKLRVPYWATNGMTIVVNGKEVAVDAKVSSYVTLEGIKAGDVIEVTIPWSLHLDYTPDKLGSADVASIMYGPLVMAAEDDNTDWTTLILSETISDSFTISTDEETGFPVLTAKGYTFRPMFASEYATNAYTTYFKTLLIADDGKTWYDVSATNRTPLNGTIETNAQADMIKEGTDLIITLSPNDGYVAKKLIVNGEEVQDEIVDNVYTLENVSGAVEVSVSFRPPTLDYNDLEYSASLECDTWYDWYGSPYTIMKDWDPTSSTTGYIDENGASDLAYRNWWTPGSWSWLQYDWDEEVTITKFQLYWAVNSDQSWCALPADIMVKYLDENGEWQDANLTSEYEDMVNLDQYNDITFDTITTTAVRLYVQTKSGGDIGALGIFRWKVIGVDTGEADPTPEPTGTPDPTTTPEPTGTPDPTTTPDPTGTPAPTHVSHVGKTFTVNGLKYKVTKDTDSVKEVRVTSMTKKKSTLTIPAKVTNSGWGESFKVTSIKAKAFKGTAITKAVIGKNVTKIGPNAFANCKKLKSVVIGKNVKTIGVRAFYGCTKLTKVTIKSTVLSSVKKNAFRKISKKAVIKVPAAKKKKYKNKLNGKIAKGVAIK